MSGKVWLALLVAGMLALPGCRKQSSPPAPAPGDVASAGTLPRKGAPDYVPDNEALIASNNRGVGLMGRFEYAAAREVFADLVRAQPNWLDVQVNLAIATFNRQLEGDEAAAMEILRAVLEVDPSHLRGRYCAGLLLRRAGQTEEALEHFRFVCQQSPDDAYAAYLVGQCMEAITPGEFQEPLQWYLKAKLIDPYFRSPYYRASFLLQRMERSEEARQVLQDFQRLNNNPRAHTFKEIYTRLGPKADALAVDRPGAAEPVRPAGPAFAEAAPLLEDDATYTWNDEVRDRPGSITACDLNGDGRLDLFLADALRHGNHATNAVCLQSESGAFALAIDHALASVTDVRAALWGDFDNDGLTDVYLCRRGPNHLWQQTAPDTWENVTEATGTAAGDFDTIDGAFVDADHDGDLDIFCVNADGPDELLNNNLDGTFRPLAAERRLAGGDRPSRQVLVADLDRDLDVDLLVLHAQPPHEVWMNDRLWSYVPGVGFDELVASEMTAAAAADLDADGCVEIIAVADAGTVTIWRRDTQGTWQVDPQAGAAGETFSERWPQLAIADVRGDGMLEVLRSGMLPGVSALDHPLIGWTPTVLHSGSGPAVAGYLLGAGPILWSPGPGRFDFTSLRLTGRSDTGSGPPPMRSNASGIGTRIAARVDSHWTITDTFGRASGPGQSLQPVSIGLRGHDHLDYLVLDWSDGVYQSEVHGLPAIPDASPRDFGPGRLERIEEIQRVKSSCPVLFAWDGTTYRFVSDLLGVGGIGYLLAPGSYAQPRPWENFLLPAELLKPREGKLVLKLAEPMEEACYLDAARLVAYELPPDWSMTLDERMGILGPAPTGEPRFYRREVVPARAVNDRGENVTAAVAERDLLAAPVGPLDRRFLGRLEREHVLTLEFEAPLDEGPGDPMLVIDGWVEYPYSQTMFAAWQAGATYDAPTLEARDAAGRWQTVLEQFGYPAGMPREMSVPLPSLPGGTTALRLRTNQEIYFDRIAVAFSEPCPMARVQLLEQRAARVERCGFAARTSGPQRQPQYDYDDRPPFWDARHQAGQYTAFGPAGALVRSADDALAIIGPGEEIHLEFVAPADPPAPGWSRRFVLETVGWCKDMDLFTRDGETLAPLPGSSGADPEWHEMVERLNRRTEAGP